MGEGLWTRPGGEWLVAAVAGWGVAYVLVRSLLPQRSKDFANRCVSLLHVVVASSLCTHSIRDWSHPLDGIGGPSTPAQMWAIVASLAYFIYDFLCCIIELPWEAANAIHHLLSILGLAFGFMQDSCGTELVACLWLMELSNPFMHARELLKELGLKNTGYALLNDVCFALVFTIARMGIGPIVTYATLQAESPLAVKVGAVGIQVVSFIWFLKIAKMVQYKLRKQKESKTK